MSIDTYKLTSMEEPTDEVLSQLMREAAEEARETNAQATPMGRARPSSTEPSFLSLQPSSLP